MPPRAFPTRAARPPAPPMLPTLPTALAPPPAKLSWDRSAASALGSWGRERRGGRGWRGQGKGREVGGIVNLFFACRATRSTHTSRTREETLLVTCQRVVVVDAVGMKSANAHESFSIVCSPLSASRKVATPTLFCNFSRIRSFRVAYTHSAAWRRGCNMSRVLYSTVLQNHTSKNNASRAASPTATRLFDGG